MDRGKFNQFLKKLEAKWKADDELFFLQHRIAREEVLYGKKPEVPHVVIPVADTVVASAVELVVEVEIKPDVDCIIPNPPIDVVHVDSVQFEAKTLAVQFVDVVDDRGEVIVDISHDHVVSEEIIVEYHAPPIEELDDVHDSPVVCDDESHDRIFMESDPIDEELNIDVMEATQDEMVECHDDLVDIPCVELPEDAPVILVGDGHAIAQLKEMQATHMYYDPFLLHCTPFNFVIADFYALELKLYKRMITVLFTSFILLDIVHSECLLVLVCPRLLFDPGGFEGESFRTGRE